MRFASAWRASSLVETLRSPCMRTTSGSPVSFSMMSVFTTWCSGTPSAAEVCAVPPFSTYSKWCSVKATPCPARNTVAGVPACFMVALVPEQHAGEERAAGADQDRSDHAPHLLLREAHVDAVADLEADPHEGRQGERARERGGVQPQP